MKKIIEDSGMTIKEFAEYYDIPYNTVRQWYNGTSNAPKYLTKLLKENRELKAKGEQLEIPTNRTYYVIEKEMTTGKFLDIYEKDSISYNADKTFWEGEAKKMQKYAPKVRCFEVMEV